MPDNDMTNKTAVIFGAVPGDDIALTDAGSSPVFFCDGGISYADRIRGGKRFFIGDLDSVEDCAFSYGSVLSGTGRKELSELNNGDVLNLAGNEYNVLRFPVRKDASDLELAIEYAAGCGAEKMIVYGCLGGNRPDHMLVNLLMLARYAEGGIKMIMTNGRETYAAFRDSEITVSPFKGHIGVLAAGGPAVGVCIRGLSYEAEGITLIPGSTLGTSNYFDAEATEPARIAAEKGTLIVCGNFGPDKIEL